MHKNIKHIFFDLDDTLWDFEKNSAIILEEIFTEYALEDKLNASFEEFHGAYKKINAELWTKYYTRQIDKNHLRNNRFHEAFMKFDYNNYEENLHITGQYLARSPFGKHLKEGCVETLDYLKQKYSLHIITNGFKEVQNIKINNCGLRDYFSSIIISEEHDLTKPDEKIFRLSENLTGCSRHEAVMIGDNFESDIAGALGAGWNAIWLNGTAEHEHIHKVKKLDELKLLF